MKSVVKFPKVHVFGWGVLSLSGAILALFGLYIFDNVFSYIMSPGPEIRFIPGSQWYNSATAVEVFGILLMILGSMAVLVSIWRLSKLLPPIEA